MGAFEPVEYLTAGQYAGDIGGTEASGWASVEETEAWLLEAIRLENGDAAVRLTGAEWASILMGD